MAVYFFSNIGDILSKFLPSDTATQVGTSQSAIKEAGNLYVTTAAKLSPGTSNGAYVVAFFPIPAKAFDVANRLLAINANGGTNSVANVMTVTLVVTATLPVIGSVAPSGTTIASCVLAQSAAAGWSVAATIAKYGIAGSNTQMAVHNAAITAGTVTALTAPTALTLTEASTNYVVLAINNATAIGDSWLSLLQAEWCN